MPEIKPLMTKGELHTLNSDQSPPGDRRHKYKDLPGVTTDAKMISEDRPPVTGPYGNPDAAGFEKNRELARRIKEAVKDLKPQTGGGHFMIAWRLYPNGEHPRFQTPTHACGCGCGCGCG
jgi:hypothetical protein